MGGWQLSVTQLAFGFNLVRWLQQSFSQYSCCLEFLTAYHLEECSLKHLYDNSGLGTLERANVYEGEEEEEEETEVWRMFTFLETLVVTLFKITLGGE